MSSDESKAKRVPGHGDDYHEALAGQEQTYLDEVRDNVRKILECEAGTAIHDAVSLEECLNLAAEELITGDSDDPPLSEETVTEILKMTSITRRIEPS